MGGEPPPIFKSRYRRPSGVTTSGASATSRVLASSLATSSRVLICGASVFAQPRGSASAAQRLQCEDARGQHIATPFRSACHARRPPHPTPPHPRSLACSESTPKVRNPTQASPPASPNRRVSWLEIQSAAGRWAREGARKGAGVRSVRIVVFGWTSDALLAT